jgi:hypothetical protein
MSTNRGRYSWVMAAFLAGMLGAPANGRGALENDRSSGVVRSAVTHHDPSIRRALSLLDWPASVPIEVVDVAQLAEPLRRAVGRACTFVRVGLRRAYVSSACSAYVEAETSLFDAMKLAALLRHELAHLDDADEPEARIIEARTFRDLLRRGPAEYLRPGMEYANAVERHAAALLARRAPTRDLARTATVKVPAVSP